VTKLYAIERIADGALLPDVRRHNSYAEFDSYGAPRIFCTKTGANTALINWCAGYWRCLTEWESTNEYGDGYYIQGLPAPIGEGMRDRALYRVIEVKVEKV